jgi:hypothetical protein
MINLTSLIPVTFTVLDSWYHFSNMPQNSKHSNCQNLLRYHSNLEHFLYRCLQIREFRNQSVVWDHFISPNMKKKSGLPLHRYIGLKVHSLNCIFFKYRLKSSMFIIIYGVDDCGK